MKNLKSVIGVFLMLILVFTAISISSCGSGGKKKPVSSSGIKKATANIKTQADGLTVEQHNVKKRLERDNKVGSIKHLYVFSAYSGQVLIYSTVRGKVTSGGKRLTSGQTLVNGDRGEWSGDFVMNRIQDDGTYGSSMNYLYWFDTKDVFHQHYVTGGQILHVSDQPLVVPSIIINMELTAPKGGVTTLKGEVSLVK